MSTGHLHLDGFDPFLGAAVLLRCPKFPVRFRSQNFDRCHSLRSLLPPPAALPSLPGISPPVLTQRHQKRGGLSLLFFGAADRDRTGTDFTPRDFKSLVSACSTTAAWLQQVWYHIFCLSSSYNWSIFKLKGSKQLSINQFSSGICISCMERIVCSAAESNSVLPAFCSSMHLI